MRVARRVRRAGRGNPPGVSLAGRPGPTQLGFVFEPVPTTACVGTYPVEWTQGLAARFVALVQSTGKVCEDAGIKIDSVASSQKTKSARDMIEALIAGQRDPRVLADLARG